eukprot:8957656-Pyramimonas_sp.AAC.1
MIQEAAAAWREAQSCGRRSGWGHIGHAGFKRSYTAYRKPPRFENPQGTPLTQPKDPRIGAPEHQPPTMSQSELDRMRSVHVIASPAASRSEQIYICSNIGCFRTSRLAVSQGSRLHL